ncbi:hypothetical protein ASPBRDRAFT_490529 [Aspergillus brasiliensis CBS 101740]|uniref:Uncharacterized protein n=1 Tax=Aspergillus brasiliensis (strain CBS 101740 / IMI 381727 / IBT 21946) TaxID=767769 RepID=A0A1L9U1Q3_ASPBC|nr:hypothetical protein ASPBRDRAFT_490529 [Aspergillus brasiliensis CBS 101740]
MFSRLRRPVPSYRCAGSVFLHFFFSLSMLGSSLYSTLVQQLSIQRKCHEMPNTMHSYNSLCPLYCATQ